MDVLNDHFNIFFLDIEYRQNTQGTRVNKFKIKHFKYTVIKVIYINTLSIDIYGLFRDDE